MSTFFILGFANSTGKFEEMCSVFVADSVCVQPRELAEVVYGGEKHGDIADYCKHETPFMHCNPT